MIQPLVLLVASLALRGDVPTKPVNSTFATLTRPVVLHRDTTSRSILMNREIDRRLAMGDVGGARAVYRSLIAYSDSVGEFPGEPLWALATLEFSRGREVRAAQWLDALADAAVRYGRPDWQARAVLEAGLLYQQHGRTDLSVERYRTLVPLLDSPLISEEQRAAMKARVVRR